MSTFTCPIVTVKTVTTHPNADKLDILTFEEIGWRCVEARDKRKPGDKVVYIPIDAMVDCTRPEFSFLVKVAKMRKVETARTTEGVIGDPEYKGQPVYETRPVARIKTIKLRGEISQGLVIDVPSYSDFQIGDIPPDRGNDMSSHFGVVKYEPPAEAVFSANAKGSFPLWCPKTDVERYQNHVVAIKPYLGRSFLQSLKLDGTSLTLFYDAERPGDEIGVCSRNQELKRPDIDITSSDVTKFGFAMDTYWKTVMTQGWIDKITRLAMKNGFPRVAVQAELCGPGIQGNKLGLTEHKAFAFDIYVSAPGQEGYFAMPQFLQVTKMYEFLTVPIITLDVIVKDPNQEPDFQWVSGLKYQNGHPAEGVVYNLDEEINVYHLGRMRFKFINPEFLLKEKDE
jgi:RNA ligase (TIGR02306 family)